MYHASCKVEFQPFKRSYSQLTFFNLKKIYHTVVWPLPTTPNVVWPRYTERGRWVRCWLGEQLLFFGSDFSLYSNLRCEREKEGKLQSEPVGAWLKKYTYSLLMELFPRTWLQEYSTMPRVLGILRNILYPIWCSVGNSTHVEFSKSCRILKILSNSQNPIEFSKILSNILYPIEYSYGSSEDSTIYLTVSIAYSIYSTSQKHELTGEFLKILTT